MAKTKMLTTKATEDPQPIAKGLVSRLYDDIIHERCVVFLGAGCTTERTYLRRKSFYEHIREISNYPNGSPVLTFPDLMQYFCEHHDGGRHNRLISEALSHIQFFCASGENNRDATMFTDSLAEIPYLNRFVTTNWDPFLERSLDVLVPMIEDRDLAFWDDHKRQVLKIHGCITRPYSLVATQDDYDKCVGRSPLIFNKLNDLMATKTFLFTGYSMRDADFQKVWGGIVNTLGQLTKMAYALDPKASNDQIATWKDRGIQILRVTDIMFIRTLRERLVKEDLVPSERFLHFLRQQRQRIVSIHINNRQTTLGQVASAMYQDGLLLTCSPKTAQN
jgi:hypothetical protein